MGNTNDVDAAPVEPVVMPRISDENGEPVDHGKTWYWARNRRGQIVGVGKFAWLIGQNTATFFINGTGYGIESFAYIPAEPPIFPDACEHGVNEGQWCSACNRAYKEALTINEPAE